MRMCETITDQGLLCSRKATSIIAGRTVCTQHLKSLGRRGAGWINASFRTADALRGMLRRTDGDLEAALALLVDCSVQVLTDE